MGAAVSVTAAGPLFDGQVEKAVTLGLQDGLEDTAQEGVDLIRQRLAGVLRHPTGRYQSRIQVERAGSDRTITDGAIIYGPWLEGISHRNQSTRFKGYATFRRTTQDIDRVMGPLVERAISDRLGGM